MTVHMSYNLLHISLTSTTDVKWLSSVYILEERERRARPLGPQI